MKKQAFSILMMVGAFAASSSYAQIGTPGTPTPTTQSQNDPKSLSDQTMRTKLSTDLSTRSSQLGNNTVSWFDSGYGYYGTYSLNDTEYMTRYDRQGAFQQTYTRSDWNESSVPAHLRTAFNQSQYNGQNVTGYWTTVDSAQKGYYMEVQNNDGKISRIYADDKGKFSSQPTRVISSLEPKE